MSVFLTGSMWLGIETDAKEMNRNNVRGMVDFFLASFSAKPERGQGKVQDIRCDLGENKG